MGRIVVAQVDDKDKWAVGANLFELDGASDIGPCVIVPWYYAHYLSDEEIGKRVRSLAQEAELIYEEEWAAEITSRLGGMDFSRSNVAYAEENELLTRPEIGPLRTHSLQQAASLISEYLAIARARARARAERSAVSANYERLFVAVGRRDGFHCAACKSTQDLQIDHVVPVSAGGDSTRDNLQILCRSCNAEKGTSSTDYRIKRSQPGQGLA